MGRRSSRLLPNVENDRVLLLIRDTTNDAVVLDVVVVITGVVVKFKVVLAVFGSGSEVADGDWMPAVDVARSTSTIPRTTALLPAAGDERRVPLGIVRAARRLALVGDADGVR